MKNIIIFCFLCVTSFMLAQEESVEAPKIIIKIPLGESIALEGYEIKFQEVLEDSRCPKNTTCVWEGRVRAVVEVTEKGKENIKKTLIFGKLHQGETDQKEILSFQNKIVMGYTVNPYPNSKEALDGDPYELLIYIEE